MNWIVGNEINVRSLWNYMQYVDLKTYVKEYVRAFRICYNTIKSMNANARVYISLDQQWKKELTSESSYNSRDVLDEFNAQIAREGNIGWGLAHHPYSVPMTWPKFWELSEQNQELVRESEDTAMVTIYNIDVAGRGGAPDPAERNGLYIHLWGRCTGGGVRLCLFHCRE